MTGRPKLVLLGMMTKMPVAGVVWQTLHYLVGFRRLGFDAHYVEAHARTPSMLMRHEDDDSSALAAGFIDRVMRRFDLADRWAFHALHSDGEVHGMSAARLRRLYADAEVIINLHGGTQPLPEHHETGRLVYLETDPVLLQVELAGDLAATIDFLEPHVAFFTFAENLGRADCRLPVSERFAFRPTRQPVVLDFWSGAGEPTRPFTTIGNWRQPWRDFAYGGERYTWSKHEEFQKFLALPERTGAAFELALSSYDDEDRRLLERCGWGVRPALEFSTDVDAYRDFIRTSRCEFTVAKDQNVRFRTGWFSDRSATYLASGRPVITQDTGFGGVLPTGEGLFAFVDLDDATAAVEAVRAEPGRHRAGAFAVAREFFDAERVLARLLDEAGVSLPRTEGRAPGAPLPPGLVLEPESRRPVRLPAATVETALARPLPPPGPRLLPVPRTSIVVVTLDQLALTRLCLETVLSTTGAQVEVIVVDNGSRSETVGYLEALARRDARVRVIGNTRNRGFVGATNQGLAAARGDVLVLLNNDTVLPPGWLERLERPLEDPAVGLVGATTNAAANEARIRTSYRTYGELVDFATRRALDAAGRVTDVRVVTLFCAALRRDVLEAVGGLDERFEVGLFEDDDLSLRVRAAGRRVVLAEDAFVHHVGEATFGALVATGDHAKLFRANQRRFEAKWQRRWEPHDRREDREYELLVERIGATVAREVPAGATIAVVSNGDDALLSLPGRVGWHFPQQPDGTYAGHHPGDSHEALAHLDGLRRRGASHVLFPATALWWLDHYAQLNDHLRRRAELVVARPDTCMVFTLPDAPRAAPAHA